MRQRDIVSVVAVIVFVFFAIIVLRTEFFGGLNCVEEGEEEDSPEDEGLGEEEDVEGSEGSDEGVHDCVDIKFIGVLVKLKAVSW